MHMLNVLLRLLVGLLLKVPVNSYVLAGTLSLPNHTCSCASLNKSLASTSCTYVRFFLHKCVVDVMLHMYLCLFVNIFVLLSNFVTLFILDTDKWVLWQTVKSL